MLLAVPSEASHSDDLDVLPVNPEVSNQRKARDANFVFMRLQGIVQPRVVHGLVDRSTGLAFLRQNETDERRKVTLPPLIANLTSANA
jgi:diadenosine tetraphosphatase ApaH/serine/threonine PP2A family protein phosphatase